MCLLPFIDRMEMTAKLTTKRTYLYVDWGLIATVLTES